MAMTIYELAKKTGLVNRHRSIVSADALALLSIGLDLAYALALLTFSLENRGWPYWLTRIAPTWFPGPVEVAWGLLPTSIAVCGIGLLLAEREACDPYGRVTPVPFFCMLSWIFLLLLLVVLAALSPTWLFAGYRSWAFWVYGVCVVLAVLVVPRHVRHIRLRHRYLSGCCINCSYDLTGNTSGVCPECGSARR
jgi:hypothetical protein